MVAWLKQELQTYYSPVRTLKQTESSCVAVLRHNISGARIIQRTYRGSAEIYQALVGIRHTNLPVIYEAAEADGWALVLEEYIDGDTIADRLDEGVYGEKEARRVVSALCNGLSALHLLGIIHRDIKPENVMLDRRGVVKLIDFDAAKFYKAYQSGDTQLIGTTGFAAPEQFGIAQSDERTDVFSIGILLNVMLTGEHPSRKLYSGKKLAKVIRRCTQISPDNRYQNAQAVAREL